MDPRPEQYSAASSMPSLVTTIGSPGSRPRTCSPYCRDKQPTSYSVPAGAAYEDIVAALKGSYGDQQLAAAYGAQLKAKVQLIGKTLQEFAAAVEQLAHRVLVGLPVDLSRWRPPLHSLTA
jgi:hypothetical protein